MFGQQCTLVAEVFVVLTMFWGGLNVILLVPVLRGITIDRLLKIPSQDQDNTLQMLETTSNFK